MGGADLRSYDRGEAKAEDGEELHFGKCVKKGLINECERYYSSCEKSVESASKCINNENRRGREGRRAQAALQTYKSRCVSQYLQGKS